MKRIVFSLCLLGLLAGASSASASAGDQPVSPWAAGLR